MKRTTALTAFVAAGVLLLAGCGKDTGTATPASDTAAAVSTQDSRAVDQPSSDTDSSAGDDSADSGTSADDSADSGTSADDSADSGTSADDSADSGTSADDSADSGTSADDGTTIGSNGDLDETSTAWFSTFCEGMAPVTDLKDLQSKIDPSDAKKTFSVVADAMTKLGSAFTDSASKLKGLPAPTFDGGDEFASKIQTTFGELGPKFTELGKKFASADPNDPASMSELSNLGTALGDATKPLQDLQSLKIDPATQAAIGEIPACKKLNG